VQRLAEEQAALRRVATLVAEGAAPTEVFDAVIAEVAQLLGSAQIALIRAEGSDEITILAYRGQALCSSEPECACRSTAKASPLASCGRGARRD
jgi:GAF domain-containing protein